METYLTYLFEANCTLLLCGFFYYLFLKNETDFKGRRFYLIGAAGLSLVIPLLHLNFLMPSNTSETLKGVQALILPEIVIGRLADGGAASAQESLPFYVYIYILGALILCGWFLFQIGQVIWFYSLNYSRKSNQEHYTVLRTNGTLPTFSFFRILFFDDSVPLSAEEQARIIAHEESHIRELHSLDIVLLELPKILFWFNPVAWFFRTEIQDIHEYLADAASVKNSTADEYSALLAKMALNKAHLPIGHHFNKSKTLKRIKMMQTTKSKIKKWKWLSTLSMATVLFIAFSCNDEAMNDIQTVMDDSAISYDIPSDMQLRIDELKKKDPSGDYVYLETSMDNQDEVERLKAMDPKTIAAVNVNKDENILGMVVKQNGTINNVVEKFQQDNDVFTVVEEPAQPQGGMPGFYAYIAENLKYPAEAEQAGIQGKVYVQMIIDTDGSVASAEVVKGIGYGCDEEALRVLSASPKWSPGVQRGKAVKQKVIVPLHFSLGDAEEESGNSSMDIAPGGKMNIETRNDGLKVWGKVKNEEGKPMPGVNIVIAGTHSGTVSDLDGSFKIELTNPDQQLHFSYVGYETVRKTIK